MDSADENRAGQGARRTMSVPEMRRLLGIKKTESYWLVHRNFFKTDMIGGRMRIDIESFEKWYANQVKHKKVNGEPPGRELKERTYSFQAAANILGIHDCDLYKVWKNEGLEYAVVDFKRRIPIENEYHDYNLVMATTFGLPIGDSYLRNKMQDIIDELGLPDVVFHSLRHTSVTYKLKLSGGDIKAVQGDSGHAQADMVTEVYGHIIDEDRRKNAEMMENALYNKENLNPQMRDDKGESKKIKVPDGVDAELLMKVLANPEMAALLTSLAKTMKV